MLDEVLAAYGLVPLGMPRLVEGGTLNWNYRVETPGGPVFARCHRPELDVQRIRAEHAIIAFAAESGVPVALPLVGASGSTTTVTAGNAWAIFPWVNGRTARRGQTTPAEAAVLGEMHGRIHAAFAGHPASSGAQFTMLWDKTQSLSVLEQAATLAEQRDMPASVQDAIAFQRTLLAATPLAPPSAFASLPCQLTHGDYHNEQVLLGVDGTVAAVVDWELAQVTARAWEVVRSLAFSQLLHTPLLEDYLRGYRQHVRLSEEECSLGVELWWQSRVNGTWVWAAYFLQGNDRVSAFFPAVVPGLKRLADPADRRRLVSRMTSVMAEG